MRFESPSGMSGIGPGDDDSAVPDSYRRSCGTNRDPARTEEVMAMNATRVFTAPRIVALAVIGMLILGLGSLRFAAGDSPVSVPAGAKAGDLTMQPCTYTTEAGALPADCGTLVVPENRADPQSRLIALPVTRIGASSANPAEPIFW